MYGLLFCCADLSCCAGPYVVYTLCGFVRVYLSLFCVSSCVWCMRRFCSHPPCQSGPIPSRPTGPKIIIVDMQKLMTGNTVLCVCVGGGGGVTSVVAFLHNSKLLPIPQLSSHVLSKQLGFLSVGTF